MGGFGAFGGGFLGAFGALGGLGGLGGLLGLLGFGVVGLGGLGVVGLGGGLPVVGLPFNVVVDNFVDPGLSVLGFGETLVIVVLKVDLLPPDDVTLTCVMVDVFGEFGKTSVKGCVTEDTTPAIVVG